MIGDIVISPRIVDTGSRYLISVAITEKNSAWQDLIQELESWQCLKDDYTTWQQIKQR